MTISTSSYTFRYFDLKGFGEITRLMLTHADAKWTEVEPEWPGSKEDQPYGKLPVLIESCGDGSTFTLAESKPIEGYVARKHGYLPKDDKLAAKQEELRSVLTDAISIGMQCKRAHDAGWSEGLSMLRELYADRVGRISEVHARALRENGDNGHFFGSEASYIDFAMYAFLGFIRILEADFSPDEEIFKGKEIPEFSNLKETLEQDPRVAEYIAGRRLAPQYYEETVTQKLAEKGLL